MIMNEFIKDTENDKFKKASQVQFRDLFMAIGHGLIVSGDVKEQENGMTYFEKTLEKSGGFYTYENHSVTLTYQPGYVDVDAKESALECATIKTTTYVDTEDGIVAQTTYYSFIRKNADSDIITLEINIEGNEHQLLPKKRRSEEDAASQMLHDIRGGDTPETQLSEHEGYRLLALAMQLR